MKKILVIGAVLAVVAFLAGAAGLAYAQSQTPNGLVGVMMNGRGPGFSAGMMAGRGGMMNGYAQNGQTGDGPFGAMHDYMFAALADALDLSVEDLQARVDAGETPYEIAQSQGLTDEEISTLFADAQAAALEAAVAEGAITQEQADLMSSRMGGRGFGGERGFGPGMMEDYGEGYGPGRMGGRGHMSGPGFGGGMMGAYGSGEYGPMHEYMIAALAEGLDLSTGDLQARIDAGETPYEVAQAQGLSEEEITTLFTGAHTTALAQAVEAGVITQEQADWMSEHMSERDFGQGYGPGAGAGMMGGNGSCPGGGRR